MRVDNSIWEGLGVTSGWTGVTITKFFSTILIDCQTYMVTMEMWSTILSVRRNTVYRTLTNTGHLAKQECLVLNTVISVE